MRESQGRRVARWWVLAALAAAGCNNGPSGLPGAVNLDGKPLAGASITLHPEQRNSGLVLVAGTSDPDGRFVLTAATGKPIGAGSYKMTVSKHAEPTPQQAAAAVPTPELLPAKYSNLAKTELSVTVPTDGEIHLNLTR